MRRRTKIRIGRVIILIGAIFSLEILSWQAVLPPTILTPPTEMASTLVQLVSTGEVIDDLLRTLQMVMVAFAAALLLGTFFGWVLWRNELLKQVLDPYLVVLYALPVFVFYPLLIVMFGYGMLPIIIIAFAMSISIIIISTANGFNQVPEVLKSVGRSLRLSRTEMFRHVLFPAAVPYIFTGLKLGFIYSFVGVIASEFIISSSGLGYLVSYYYENYFTARMYATLLLLVSIAVIANLALIRLEDHLYSRRVSR